MPKFRIEIALHIYVVHNNCRYNTATSPTVWIALFATDYTYVSNSQFYEKIARFTTVWCIQINGITMHRFKLLAQVLVLINLCVYGFGVSQALSYQRNM